MAVEAMSSESSFSVAYETGFGKAYLGDARVVLKYLIESGTKVKLIVTSPPFPLIAKKEYGNESQESYLIWLDGFVELFKGVLHPKGSLVIELGGAWVKGMPVKSTYQFEVLLHFCRSGFLLAQDFYYYNLGKLAMPAEWVSARRLRVKDAVSNIWRLVLDPFVDSDNRRVLRPYSRNMLDKLRRGFKPHRSPSGHRKGIFRNNHGSIPPNILMAGNTRSNERYLRRCRQEGLKPHPARFPQELPEFFIRLLTEPGDLVLDPFAGSNVTGAAAEALRRRWISIEMMEPYVRGSKFRFEEPPRPVLKVAVEPSYGPLFDESPLTFSASDAII